MYSYYFWLQCPLTIKKKKLCPQSHKIVYIFYQKDLYIYKKKKKKKKKKIDIHAGAQGNRIGVASFLQGET